MACGEPTTSRTNNMVASLHTRKETLEAKLREKTLELKKLCIQEAELTGILPPETPIEPSESPPVFRRKVDTTFSYSENLIHKLKSKDEEALAKLELECKTQSSIAKAALGLANDSNANKSIRRKHRHEYQRAQQRLSELEMRLNVLKQSVNSGNQLKQRKKPRPPPNIESVNASGDVISLRSGTDEIDSHFQREPSSLSFLNHDVIRNNHFYNSFGKSSHNRPSYVHHVCPQTFSSDANKNTSWNRNELYRRSVERARHNSTEDDRVSITDATTNWLEDTRMWRNTAPVGYFSNQCYTTLPSENGGTKSRYSSLDRRYQNSHNSNHSVSKQQSTTIPSSSNHDGSSTILNHLPITPPMPYNDSGHPTSQPCLPPSCDSGVSKNVVLLPNQTYPENSLTRTQSLGNVEPPCGSLDTHSLQETIVSTNFNSTTLGRKPRVKEWRETSLDATVPSSSINNSYDRRSCTPPLHAPSFKVSTADSPLTQQPPLIRRGTRTPPPLPPPYNLIQSSSSPSSVVAKSPMKSPTQIESTVLFESPKNHTIVEVGKWQPYREVTKPFEMSDFYKYSTKFRKGHANEESGNQNEQSQSQTDQSVASYPPKLQNILADNSNVNFTRSNSGDKRSNTKEIPYFDANFSNITYRRHPRLATNGYNENNYPTSNKQWKTGS